MIVQKPLDLSISHLPSYPELACAPNHSEHASIANVSSPHPNTTCQFISYKNLQPSALHQLAICTTHNLQIVIHIQAMLELPTCW